jgi:nicotinamide riboside transporter PnuC
MILLLVAVILICTTGFYFLESLSSFQKFWNGSTPQTKPVILISDSLVLVLGIVGMLLMVMAFKEQ